MTFKDLVKNRELWNDEDLVKTANYYVAERARPDSRAPNSTGARTPIAKIADEILARTVEGW